MVRLLGHPTGIPNRSIVNLTCSGAVPVSGELSLDLLHYLLNLVGGPERGSRRVVRH